MKTTRLFAMLGPLVLLAAVFPAAAQPADAPPPPPPPGGPGGAPPDPVIGMAGFALHGLELDRAQREQIHGIVRARVEGGLGQQLQELNEARRALEIAIWTPSATPEEIGALSDAVAAQALEVSLARHQVALEVSQVMTDEQRGSFLQLLSEEPPLPGGPGHGGPGGPGGQRGPGPQGR